jgi:hypothetical protein
MAWLMPLIVVALAVLGPFFGADSRDGAARMASAGQKPR